jgi:hypothetical protein
MATSPPSTRASNSLLMIPSFRFRMNRSSDEPDQEPGPGPGPAHSSIVPSIGVHHRRAGRGPGCATGGHLAGGDAMFPAACPCARVVTGMPSALGTLHAVDASWNSIRMRPR